MVILNRKRLIIITMFVFVSVFTFMIANKDNKSNTIQTVSLPVSNKTIVIDAGHGVPDERSCLLTLKITLIFYKK